MKKKIRKYNAKAMSTSDKHWNDYLRKEVIIETKKYVHKGKIKGIDEIGIVVETFSGVVFFYHNEIDTMIQEVE